VDDTTGLLTITWSVDATDDSGGTYTLVASGPKGSICTFTSGAVGTGGLLVCTATTATGTLTAKAKWQVKTAAGYDILVVGEQFEHDSSYGWTGPINNVLRNMVASASTFADSAFRVYGSSDATKLVALEVDGLTTGTTRTVTIPDKNGTLAMTSDILGPTFADNVFRITGSADATKLAAFEVDGFTTGTTRTFTLPNATATISCLSVTERFTDYEILPDIDIITAQHGNMVFRTSGGGPDGKSFTGMPRVYIPKAVLKVRWFQVPYSYIEHTDSIILRYLGHINQAEFQLGNRLWPKGSLMYRGVSVKRYTPPIPNTTILAGLSVYSPEKICDLEFYFEYTRRVNAHPLSPNPSNKNRIQEGHNCMPHYGDRKFYYVTTQAALSANQYPTYPSVPFQLLWTDPANAS
jgi:hypothetical protein